MSFNGVFCKAVKGAMILILLLLILFAVVFTFGYIIFLIVYFCSLDNEQKNPGPEIAPVDRRAMDYEYTESRVAAIKYVKVTFRDWNHNMKCEDITFTLSNPKPAGNKCEFMIDSVLFTMKNLEMFNVVFLDGNQNLLPSTDYGYKIETVNDGGYAKLYIWLA